MAAARIRRTFRYPDDSEFKHPDREELDEEGPPYKTPAIGK